MSFRLQRVIFLLHHQQLRLLTWPSTMESLNPTTPCTPKSAIPSPQTPSPSPSPSPSPLAASSSRLWRPSAQRNLRNQWSKLASLRQEWASSSSTGRVNAMSLVNAYLSMKYYSHPLPCLCYMFMLVFLKDTFLFVCLFVWCVRFQTVLVIEIWVSFRYMPSMELGVLSDMPDIRKKASQKLLKQQVISKLLLGVISLLITVLWALDYHFCLCLFLFLIWN